MKYQLIIPILLMVISCSNNDNSIQESGLSRFTIEDIQGTWWSDFNEPTAAFSILGDSVWFDLDSRYHSCWVNQDTLFFDYGEDLGLGKSLIKYVGEDSLVLTDLTNGLTITSTYLRETENASHENPNEDTLFVVGKSVVFYYKSMEEEGELSESIEQYIVEEYADYFYYLDRFEKNYADSLKNYGINLVVSTKRYLTFIGTKQTMTVDRMENNNLGVICFSPDSLLKVNSGVNVESGYLNIVNEYFGLFIQESKISDTF